MSGKVLQFPRSLAARGIDWLLPDRRVLELPTPAMVVVGSRDVPIMTYGKHIPVGRARVVRIERWGSGAAAELDVIWSSRQNEFDFATAELVANLMVGAYPPDRLVAIIPTWAPMPLREQLSAMERARWAARRIERRQRMMGR